MIKRTYLNTLEPEEVIKRLKNGKEIKYEDISLKTKMVDGVICDFDGNGEYIIGSPLKSEHGNFSYFEEEERFKIKEAGLYKTRNGRLVFVSKVGSDCLIGVINGEEFTTTWFPDGMLNYGEQDELDIVSKWEE